MAEREPRRSSSLRFTSFELDCLLQLEEETAVSSSSTNPPTSGHSHQSNPNQQQMNCTPMEEGRDEASGGCPGTPPAHHHSTQPHYSFSTSSNNQSSIASGGAAGGGQANSAEGNWVQGSLWDGFETCAHSVAKLYRKPHWDTFQVAAASVTQLYKDSVEANRRGVELGMNIGRQKLLKELLNYLKCSKRSNAFIRREELLAFLAGKSPPVRHQQSQGTSSPLLRTLDQLGLQSSPTHRHIPGEECPECCSPALYMFHEALALPSDTVYGSSASNATGGSARNSPSKRGNNYPHQEELSSFLMDEVRRHRKRRFDGTNSVADSRSSGFPPGSGRSPGGNGGKRRRM